MKEAKEYPGAGGRGAVAVSYGVTVVQKEVRGHLPVSGERAFKV